MWTKRQFRIRRSLMDRLAVWAASGWSVQWVNLTSSPNSDPERLMAHFLALRRMMATRLGVPVEHAGVRTSEGFGVLHVLMAAKVERGKAWSTVCNQAWLSETWGRLHGAPIVWISSVKLDTVDRARISRYMVTQYMARGQGDALVRFFQSRQTAWEGVSLARIRKRLRELVRPNWLPYRGVAMPESERPTFYKDVAGKSRKVFQSCWHALLDARSFSYAGSVYVVDRGDLIAL